MFVQKLANSIQGNIVLSPASIKSALGLLLEGAKGKTEEELREALRLPMDKESGNKLLLDTQKALKVNIIRLVLFQNAVISKNTKMESTLDSCIKFHVESVPGVHFSK